MIVVISGGFDPIHVGHIKYISEAAKLGDALYVILNTDDFLIKKKGYVFMPYREREEVLRSIRNVDLVYKCIDKDQSVCESLKVIQPEIFAKGGDKTIKNIPEVKVCRELKIRMVFGVGGKDKPQSSSWLINRLIKQVLEREELRKHHGISKSR